MRENNKKVFDLHFDFLSLVHVPSANMEEARFMTCSQPLGGIWDTGFTFMEESCTPLLSMVITDVGWV